MPAKPDLLQTALWKGFAVDTLYTFYNGEVRPQNLTRALSVYHPAEQIPLFVFCRTSESTKRLDAGLDAEQAVAGPWGAIYEVRGGGSSIGVMVEVTTERFSSAFCTPDGVHLCHNGDAGDAAVMKELFSYKTFRAFRFGLPGVEDGPHDLMLTAKQRWFRRRNNPKFLGFSKDNKT